MSSTSAGASANFWLAEGGLDHDLVVAHPLLLVGVPHEWHIGPVLIQLAAHPDGFLGRLRGLPGRVFANFAHFQDSALLPEQIPFLLF